MWPMAAISTPSSSRRRISATWPTTPRASLIGWSPKLRAALNAKYEFVHPEHPAINGLSHVQWTGVATVPGAHARNAVFYGDKAIDRSPCGTGTSARMAQLAAKGKLGVGDEFHHESIIGSIFKGRVEAATTVAGKPAIIPRSPAGHGRPGSTPSISMPSAIPLRMVSW